MSNSRAWEKKYRSEGQGELERALTLVGWVEKNEPGPEPYWGWAELDGRMP